MTEPRWFEGDAFALGTEQEDDLFIPDDSHGYDTLEEFYED